MTAQALATATPPASRGHGPALPAPEPTTATLLRDRVPISKASTFVRQALRFLAVGVGATVANALLYVAFRAFVDAAVANIAALVVTTVASSMAHRVVTFTGSDARQLRMYVQSVAVLLFYCVSNNIALWLLGLVTSEPSAVTEAVAISLVGTLGGLSRFLVLRGWVFHEVPDDDSC